MFIIIYGLLNIIDKSVNQPFYSIQKERRYKWGRLLFSDWHKLLIQAADTLSLILQNICELSYPLNPVILVVGILNLTLQNTFDYIGKIQYGPTRPHIYQCGVSASFALSRGR